MLPALTQFGEQMSHLTGVRAIMKDIIETLRTAQGREFINLSAGNPVILPEVEQLWRDCTMELLDSPEYGEVVCRYGSSQGYQPLIEAVIADYNQRYGLNLGDRNILITPGSQSLYFLAANALGGYTTDGRLKQIVLPLSPDYTGYGGVTLIPEALRAYRPRLDIDAAAHRFKYRPNFDQLEINVTTGFVLFSRPCNPHRQRADGRRGSENCDNGRTLRCACVCRFGLCAAVPVFEFHRDDPDFCPEYCSLHQPLKSRAAR